MFFVSFEQKKHGVSQTFDTFFGCFGMYIYILYIYIRIYIYVKKIYIIYEYLDSGCKYSLIFTPNLGEEDFHFDSSNLEHIFSIFQMGGSTTKQYCRLLNLPNAVVAAKKYPLTFN